MADWIRNELGWQPELEEWSAINGGSFLVGYRIGTPPGNWFWLHNEHDRYLKASAAERTKITDYAREILIAKTSAEKSEISHKH